MARRVYIIPATETVTPKVIATASLNFCSEIATGIPPRLEGVVQEISLPFVYQEPEPVEIPQPRDLAAEIDIIKSKVAVLEAKARVGIV